MANDERYGAARANPAPAIPEAERAARDEWATRAEGARPALAEAREALRAARALLAATPPPATATPEVLPHLVRAIEGLATALTRVLDPEGPAAPDAAPTPPGRTEDYWAARWRA